MSDSANQNQAVSDDQELAKVLQGMQQQNRSMAGSEPATKEKDKDADLQYEATPKADAKEAKPAASAPSASSDAAATPPVAPQSEPASLPSPAAAPAATTSSTKHADSNLETLKKEALEELRPLVDKLDLPAKEKFDTMLLIIRSTDDQALLQPAHNAAKQIEDENERAEALLDIVKEVDYFAGQSGQK